MKKFLFLTILSLLGNSTFAQKYFTKSGKVNFQSKTPLETIEGLNSSGTSVIDGTNGNIEFAVLVKSFVFDKALLQEHFNENYMESSKFPKANFKGKIDNFNTVNLTKDGTYKVKVSGNLTIHGVTKPVSTDATISTKGGSITKGSTSFSVIPADYDIKIPSVVKEKISKNIKIDINTDYQKM